MKLPNWTREPLIHFLILGAALYLSLTWSGSPPDPTSRVISIGPNEVEKIAESWTLTMGRAPTDAELDQAIDAHVREEVLYREALRLGLDESDAIVRRRMVSKMDMSASLAAEIATPSEEDLRLFWQENADQYAQYGVKNTQVSFDHLFFSDEAAALVALNSMPETGETTSLPPSLTSAPMRDVEAQFGLTFANSLTALEPSEDWQGPVPSGFGWHLVRLQERETYPADFESLRGVLANDWRAAQIRDRKNRAYQVLSSAYRIDVNR